MNTKRVAEPMCIFCSGPMKLLRVIPAVSKCPELRQYQCTACGFLRTVEDEVDLLSEAA